LLSPSFAYGGFDHSLVVGMGLWVLQFLLLSAYFRHLDGSGNYAKHLNKFLS
jgi:hypothetical protein